MKFILFYHSVISDWNHGNAHFLRGITSELMSRGHSVQIMEPYNSWSYNNIIENYGPSFADEFYTFYPDFSVTRYKSGELDLKGLLEDADLVIVHEWNDHDLVREIGKTREENPGFKLLFHDTHHRSVTDPDSMSKYDLSNYDGVLAYGKVISDIYIKKGWSEKVWTWHEAADTRTFYPIENNKSQDVVWIGNWGDEERSAEIKEYFIHPVRDLKLKASAYGVRYPQNAIAELQGAGIDYKGWVPNYLVPKIFSSARMTIHIPRRPYVETLSGIPTIRPFEALACGIPLITSPWVDSEHLFTPGKDFLIANNENEMKKYMKEILLNESFAKELSEHGLETILKRHTCRHRVDELLDICRELKINTQPETTNISQEEK